MKLRTELGHVVFCKEQLVPSDSYRKGYDETRWDREISIQNAIVRKIGHGRTLIIIGRDGK
jgi:hypothetical protein